MSESDCAIVTGGASGIGRSLVKCLVLRGAKVVFADISEGAGKEFEAELNRDAKRAAFFRCDVTDEKQLRELFVFTAKEFGEPNIVINNAGISRAEDLESSLDFIDEIVQINLVSVIKGTSLAVQCFKEQSSKGLNRDFSIINIGSILGLRPQFNIPNLGYLAGKGIRVNCIAPCFIETNITKGIHPPSIKLLVQSRGGYMDISHVDTAACFLLDNKDLAGEVYEIDPSHVGLIPKEK